MINVKKKVTVGALFVLLAQSSAMQAMYCQLYTACFKGDKNIVESLLEANADVNAAYDYGFTLLHFACDKGHIEVISLLLKANANVNAKNNYGFTPLYFACKKGHIEVVRLLLANGAQVTEIILNHTENLAIKRLVSKVYEFQHSENKLEFILKHIQNDQEEDDIFHHMRISENAKELIKAACGASLIQMLKNKTEIEDALFYKLYQHAPDILSQIFEVKSLQVDNLMDCIIEKKDPCLAEQMQERYLWLTKQMQERLAEYKNLLINTSERFEFLKQQCTDRGMTISTNDRELKMPSFLGLQIVSPLLVEEIEEEEEGE